MTLTSAKRQKRWREKNPEKVKEKHKKYAEKIKKDVKNIILKIKIRHLKDI